MIGLFYDEFFSKALKEELSKDFYELSNIFIFKPSNSSDKTKTVFLTFNHKGCVVVCKRNLDSEYTRREAYEDIRKQRDSFDYCSRNGYYSSYMKTHLDFLLFLQSFGTKRFNHFSIEHMLKSICSGSSSLSSLVSSFNQQSDVSILFSKNAIEDIS